MLFALTIVIAGSLSLSNVSPDKESFYKELFDKPNEPVTQIIEDTEDTILIGKTEIVLTSITITNEDSKTAKESTQKYYMIDFETLKQATEPTKPTQKT